MTNDESKKKYDREERTAVFGERIIDFTKKIHQNPISVPLITQVVRSGTSVGANYCEADCAETRKDFEHKIGVCKKESKETKHWLRMLITTTPELKDRATELMKETNELTLIFVAIIKKSKANKIKELSI